MLVDVKVAVFPLKFKMVIMSWGAAEMEKASMIKTVMI